MRRTVSKLPYGKTRVTYQFAREDRASLKIVGLLVLGLLLHWQWDTMRYAEIGREYCSVDRPVPKVAYNLCDWGVCGTHIVARDMIEEAATHERYRWDRCGLEMKDIPLAITPGTLVAGE